MCSSVRRIRVAIVGLGEVSLNHYNALRSTRYGELAGVFSHSRNRVEEVAKAWGTRPYYSFKELINDPGIDALIICSADEHHHDQAVEAMRAGKHVLVEKPLALSAREVADMAKVSLETNKVLMPVHNYVFRPKVRRAKELIESGAIGEPTYALFIVTQRLSEEVARRHHGALFTQSYHSIYTSNYLLGPPIEFQAMWGTLTYREVKSDEVFVATFRYRNGALGNIVANWAADDLSSYPFMWLDKVIGTKGTVTINSFDDVVASLQAGSFMMGKTVDYVESFKGIVRHFIDDVLAEGRKPEQSIYDALLVHDIIEGLRESAGSGRRIRYEVLSLEQLIEKYS
ncbi:Gfo/Idh/MocA family protein [Caldivirga maquilingensis]|uniref:Oxidoreductase domain protein n=1 Tax=Caldivirga maquilingensis (strain ATCC 700844 / DSM 13496 / JCM 10307 / IC-167) TaxID=397948 RepID=A8MBB2_CALMQ|nr:Gfo/Idh/MocA family oxidoreductase [Caldivirga maquilingensis]ABW01202.1 oxidoreductase domain protein [Caldivirga maquilingensis IC-167]